MPIYSASKHIATNGSELSPNKQLDIKTTEDQDKLTNGVVDESDGGKKKKSSEARRKRRRDHVLSVTGPYSQWKPISSRRTLHDAFDLATTDQDTMEIDEPVHNFVKFLPHDWTQPERPDRHRPKPVLAKKRFAAKDTSQLRPLNFEPLSEHELKLRTWQVYQ
ncbi:hypothetical protein FRC17_002597 [Serendipita sp. 399]|nr:hypothetical protein FRC17_002597 [Serendipita sp. 399]